MDRITKSAEIGGWPGGTTPWARAADGTLTLGTTTANYVSGGAIKLPADAAWMTVWLAVDGVTSESNAQVGVVIMLSPLIAVPVLQTNAAFPGAALPTAIQDGWHLPGTDGSVSTATPNAFPASQVMTVAPAKATTAEAGGFYLSPILSAATNKIRMQLTARPIDVTGSRWVQFLAAEVGDTSHPSKVAISFTTSTF
jgi:hypothetical protein